MMFLGLRKLGNICCGHKMFLKKSQTFFVSRTQNLCPEQMLRPGKRGNICVRNNVSSFARAFKDGQNPEFEILAAKMLNSRFWKGRAKCWIQAVPRYFKLLFCRGRQRYVPKFKTHVHSYCLVTLSSPSPSWFAKTPYRLCMGNDADKSVKQINRTNKVWLKQTA